MAAGHHHPHAPAHRQAQQRALVVALVANAAFLVVEVAGGLAFESLALLADAAHMLSDVAALGIALVAHRLVERPATARHSFGLQRAEVLAAQINGLALLGASAWIFYEAAQRIRDPAQVEGGGLLAVALGGLIVNLASAAMLARVAGASLNLRGAFAHMLADAAGSVAAVIAGLAVILADATWVDPVASIAVGLLVLVSAWQLLRDTTGVLLEGTPRGMDPAAVEAALAAGDAVERVHHLHLWNLASDTPALSAHVVLAGEVSLHEAQERGDALKTMLAERFGIAHATLELECHPCADEVAAPDALRGGHRFPADSAEPVLPTPDQVVEADRPR